MAYVFQTAIGWRSLHLLLIVIVGFAVYLNTFTAPFAFDDGNIIVDNPVVKDLGNFTSSLAGYQHNPRRYVGNLTFALNYRFGGLEVAGYHAVNLAIHLINAMLVYFFVLLTLRTPYFSGQQEVSGRVVKGSSGNDSTTQQLNCSPLSLTIHDLPAGRQGSRSFIALFSALLFVAHPIQTQAVTYIVQRFTSLATMFYLLAAVLYIKSRLATEQTAANGRVVEWSSGGGTQLLNYSTTQRFTATAYFIVSLAAAICAMKTKEIAFTLPIMILLYDFTFFRSPLKKRLLFLVPILLTLAIIPLSMMHVDKPLGEVLSDMSEKTRVQTDISRGDYLMTEMRVIVTYLRLIFLPINQNLDYDYPVYQSFFTPAVICSFLLLSALFGLAVYLMFRSRQAGKPASLEADKPAEGSKQPLSGQVVEESSIDPTTQQLNNSTFHYSLFTIHLSRLIAFGILWFFLALSVESSVIPIVDVIFEHRVYLPSAGAFIALTAAFFTAAMKIGKRWPQAEKAVIPLALIIVTVYSGAAFARNRVWRDNLTLWDDVVRKAPGNARAYNNRGLAFSDRGQLDKAIDDYSTSIALAPLHYEAYANRGIAFAGKGLADKAIEDFNAVIAMHPSHIVYSLRAEAFEKKGQTDRAIEDYKQAIVLEPSYVEAYIRLGVLYGKSGFLDKAIDEFSQAVAVNPNNSFAYANRGFAYSLLGQYDQAIGDFTRAIELDRNDAGAIMSRGNVYRKTGRKELAIQDFRKACDMGNKEGCEHLKSGSF